MFKPKLLKFKKQQKGKSLNKIKILFTNLNCKNTVYLKALHFGKINSNQFNALKLVIGKKLKKKGRLIFKKFPHTPVTKKPLEIRMGKGKGPIDHWVAKIKPGAIICCIETNLTLLAIRILKFAQIRLSLKTKIYK